MIGRCPEATSEMSWGRNGWAGLLNAEMAVDRGWGLVVKLVVGGGF